MLTRSAEGRLLRVVDEVKVVRVPLAALWQRRDVTACTSFGRAAGPGEQGRTWPDVVPVNGSGGLVVQ